MQVHYQTANWVCFIYCGKRQRLTVPIERERLEDIR